MGDLTKKWLALAQVSAWLGAIVGAFVSTPARISALDSSGDGIAAFVQFLTAGVCGLGMVALRRYRKPMHARVWGALAVASLVAATVLYFTHLELVQSWTCQFTSIRRLIVGDEAHETADLKNYRAENNERPRTCQQLLQDYSGDTERMWDKALLRERYAMLCILYMALWMSCALSVMFVLQVMRCARGDEDEHADALT